MDNDYKIDNPEFWYDALDDFQMDDEIVVVEISEEHLLSQDINGLHEKGSVDFEIGKDYQIYLTKKSQKYINPILMTTILNGLFLYTSGRYVTCISG